MPSSSGSVPAPARQRGTVESIHLHQGRGAPMVPASEASLESGFGIRGDDKAGQPTPGSNLTLIAAEAVETMVAETGIPLTPGEARRNVVTRGVDLDALIGRTFRVGGAVCRGVEPSTPCNHLEAVTRPGVRAGLAGRGGLRADVLEGGVIRSGDAVEELDDARG